MTTSPLSFRISSAAKFIWSINRKFSPTLQISRRFFVLYHFSRLLAIFISGPIGFSLKTCLPAAIALLTKLGCTSMGKDIITAWISGRARRSSSDESAMLGASKYVSTWSSTSLASLSADFFEREYMAFKEKREQAWTAARCSARKSIIRQHHVESNNLDIPSRAKIPAPRIATPLDIIVYLILSEHRKKG